MSQPDQSTATESWLTWEDLHAWQILAPLARNYLPWSSASLRPSAVVTVLNDIFILGRSQIVECGGGVSTVLIARLLRQIGSGQVFTIEHDKDWTDRVKRTLVRDQLEDYAEVIHAPLTNDCWYERQALEETLPNEIDLLLVDGPPAFKPGEEQARQPALPFFLPRLTEGSAVVLDDVNRPGEQEVLRRWEAQTAIEFQRFEALGIAIGCIGRSYPLSL